MATTDTKRRAGRNRTLTLDEAELPVLRQRLLTATDIANSRDFIGRTICADLSDVLPTLPDAFADLIVIDPPYNLTKDFGTVRFNAKSNAGYTEFLHSWFHDVCRKLKPNGSLYLCGDWKCTSALQRVMEEELVILNRITWQREKGRGAKSNWKNSMEDIWFGVKDPHDYCFNVESVKMKRRVIAPYRENGHPKDWEESTDGKFRLTYPSNFWDDISVPFWSMPENTDHPTQKPEKLLAKLILASTNTNDVVFDPFLGSGTTSVVAKKLGRRFCGIEINEEYCLWAEKRLRMADDNPTIQGYTEGFFWERNSGILQSKNTSAHPNSRPKKDNSQPNLFNW